LTKKMLIILVLAISLYFPVLALAEIIVLKSGKTVEGKLIEKTDKYIKIDFQGVVLPYFLEEIQSIDGYVLKSDKKVVENNEAERLKNIYSQIKTIYRQSGIIDYKTKIKPLCLEILQLNEKKTLNYTICGSVNYLLGNDEEAISLLKKAIELNPRDAEAYTFLARVYRRAKKYEVALDAVNTAYKFQDAEMLPLILETYGLIYVSLKDTAKSCNYLEKTLSLDPERLATSELLSTIYINIGNYEKTIEICERGIRLYPKEWLLLYYLGFTCNKLNRFAKAIPILEKAQHCSEQAESVYKSRILLELARSYIQLSNLEKAKEYLSKAKGLDFSNEVEKEYPSVDRTQQKESPNSEYVAKIIAEINAIKAKNPKAFEEEVNRWIDQQQPPLITTTTIIVIQEEEGSK